MTTIFTNLGTLIEDCSTNTVLLTACAMMIAAAIGRLAFGTVKRFIRR